MNLSDSRLIIVTGGAGFIGSGVVRWLNDRGFYHILIVDDFGHDEKWKNLVGKQFLDVLSPSGLWDWLDLRKSPISTIIHLGACSDTMETDAEFLMENNFRYSVKLMQYALDHHLRFIYASSAATYGNGSEGFSDELKELHHLRPLNMYGFSKQLVDQWAAHAGVLEKIVAVKYFNVFGPNEAHKGRMASAIFKMVPQIIREGKVQLFKSCDSRFGDGEQQRDFLYVKEAVEMTMAFLEKQAGGIYNVGSGQPISWNRLAKAVFAALKKPPQIEYIDMPENLVGKYQNYSCANMDKTQRLLGKEPYCRPFEDAVKEYVCEYLCPGKSW